MFFATNSATTLPSRRSLGQTRYIYSPPWVIAGAEADMAIRTVLDFSAIGAIASVVALTISPITTGTLSTLMSFCMEVTAFLGIA